jgi:hypothetical protein
VNVDDPSNEPDLMARLERSLQPGGWRERVGCTCKADDGSYVCPRQDECMAAWYQDQQRQRRNEGRAAMDAYVVFDGPPAPESGRFIEVEDGHGHGLGPSSTGANWRRDEREGWWQLGPFLCLTDRERAALQLVARERSVDRSGAAWEEPPLKNFSEDEWTALAEKLKQ